MTTSNPSFPPADDLIAAVRSIDVKTALQNFKTAGRNATDCLIWAAAITVVTVQYARKLLPHLAIGLRALADLIDPDSAPLTPPMTARDIPDTLEFFTQRDRMVRPEPTVPPAEELAIPENLATKTKVELMALAGTTSRRLNKEQLIFKIEEARRS